MKKIVLVFVLFGFLLCTQTAFGNEFTVKPIEIENPEIPLNIRFLTTGSMLGSKFIRVSIMIEEIYPSIFIEEIIRGEVEGEPDKIVSHYLISGFDIAEKFGYTSLMGLKFVKWNAWNEFEMADKKIEFVVRYNDKKQFQIKSK
jgi:hypothetical protein